MVSNSKLFNIDVNCCSCNSNRDRSRGMGQISSKFRRETARERKRESVHERKSIIIHLHLLFTAQKSLNNNKKKTRELCKINIHSKEFWLEKNEECGGKCEKLKKRRKLNDSRSHFSSLAFSVHRRQNIIKNEFINKSKH